MRGWLRRAPRVGVGGEGGGGASSLVPASGHVVKGEVGQIGSTAQERTSTAAHEAAARAVLAAMTSSPAVDEPVGFGGASMTGMPTRGGNLSAVRGEEAFARTMWEKGRDGLVVVKFGASWCTHCAGMLPEFGAASREHPDAHFVLADVDTLPDTAAEIRYTPTFTFYNKGKKVDEITKTTPRGFRDHMWLHAKDRPDDVVR